MNKIDPFFADWDMNDVIATKQTQAQLQAYNNSTNQLLNDRRMVDSEQRSSGENGSHPKTPYPSYSNQHNLQHFLPKEELEGLGGAPLDHDSGSYGGHNRGLGSQFVDLTE